ncbi:MAG: hypothetical protein ACREUF_17660 [Solimonas sp.]
MSKLKGKKAKVMALVAVAAFGALAIQSATAQVVKSGNIEIEIEGGFSPKKLPKKGKAPITLNVEGSMATTDKTHVPAVKTIFLEFDRNGELNTKGLDSCTVGKLQSTLTAQAKAACPKALVGQGRVTAEIALPEQAPFSASGPLLIFNGSQGNKQKLIFHVYANVPAPTTVVTTAIIGKGKGPYGTSANVAVPSITSGQGSLTSFKAKLAKTWSASGKKQNLLLAGCPSGSLKARGDLSFVNGTKLTGNIVKPCTPGK